MVFLSGLGSNQAGSIQVALSGGSTAGAGELKILRDAGGGSEVEIYRTTVSYTGSANGQVTIPLGGVAVLDTPSAGSHTYTVQFQRTANIGGGTTTINVTNSCLVAYET
jgi:hypothetical protein